MRKRAVCGMLETQDELPKSSFLQDFGKEDLEYFYYTYSELLEEKEELLNKIEEYEKNNLEDNLNLSHEEFAQYSHMYPDPDTYYCMILEKTAQLLKYMSYRHTNLSIGKVRFKHMHNDMLESKKKTIYDQIKKNPKLTYNELITRNYSIKDIHVALDLMIEDGEIYSVGIRENRYWKINKE